MHRPFMWNERHDGPPGTVARTRRHGAWSRLARVALPFFVSSARWRVSLAALAIVALLLTLNGLNVANSYVGRNFMTSIAGRDPARYFRFALLYLAVFAASTAIGVLSQFVQDRLALLWREWLTGHLVHRYLLGTMRDWINARKQIDNPDQRMSDDVRTFTTTLLSFAVMTLNALVTTMAFAGVLWSISPALLVCGLAYATLGSALTVVLGHRLVGLNNLQLRKEADLRHGLIQLRDHTEPSGESLGWHGRRIQALLHRVIGNSRVIIGVTRNVGFFTSGYNYLVPIVPIFIVAPRFMRHEVEFGVVTQSAMAFAQLLGAFSLIVAQFGAISAFAAVVGRLGSLWEEMEDGLESGVASRDPAVQVGRPLRVQ
jgi:putative ATP-binding cassette transporter